MSDLADVLQCHSVKPETIQLLLGECNNQQWTLSHVLSYSVFNDLPTKIRIERSCSKQAYTAKIFIIISQQKVLDKIKML
jgi:hypothetical protein